MKVKSIFLILALLVLFFDLSVVAASEQAQATFAVH